MSRGKDKKKRKSKKKGVASATAPETSKRDVLRNIIKGVSSKLKKEKREPWAFDFGPQKEVTPFSSLPGRHVFKDEVVEIDLKKL